MGRGVPAHGHAEAIHSALLEARPAGLTIVQLMAATERTRAQLHTGLAHLRQVAAAKGASAFPTGPQTLRVVFAQTAGSGMISRTSWAQRHAAANLPAHSSASSREG